MLVCKYDPAERKPLGYKQIARRLRMRVGTVRAAERAIAERIEHFAAVYCAGRLCPERELEVTSLAAGSASTEQARLALAHIAHCRHCAPRYVEQVRELRSAAFQRKVASLLPALPEVDEQRGRLRGAWDAICDTLTRPFAHDSTATVTQLAASGAGRGAGTIAALKLAALCTASVGTLGICATTVIPTLTHDPPERDRAREHRQPAPRDLRPGPAVKHLPVPTATPTPSERRPAGAGSRSTQRSDRSGPTAHEEAPASPAPANAAPDGASEFNPEYQPSAPPAPAPAPSAPGATEFF